MTPEGSRVRLLQAYGSQEATHAPMGGPTPMYVQAALSECKQQKEHMMLGGKSVEGIWKN